MDGSSDEDLEGVFELKINKDYASNYEKWRAKEEYQKLKDKYGDVKLEEESEESDSTSSEDEDAEVTPMMEKDFLRTLAALKSHDPKIYDPNVQFFVEKPNDTDKVAVEKSKKVKPMFLKDYEREIILQKDGKFSDDEDASDKEEIRKPLNYYEEQDAIRQSFKNSYSSDEDEEELLSVRVKSKEDQEKEEEEYLEWLKGQKEEVVTDKSIVAELKPLRQYWADPSLDEGEQFLRDYLLQKQYLDEDDEKRIPSYDEVIRELEEDEKELDKEEQFEKKYNFRFEEPDAEVIKSFPRVIPESLRNKDTRRVEQRQKVRERKKQEETKKREEIKRLKNMKKMEIMNKIEKLREVTGSSLLGISENDIDEDFDAEQYDKMMKKAFSEDYYGEEEDQKPVFSDMEDDEPDWDEWTGQEQEQEQDGREADIDFHCDDPDFVMDCDYDPSLRRPKVKVKVKAESKKNKKKSSFATAVEKPKPVFDSKFKSFDQYFNEYYNLDYEDIVGDVPVRFKYREVLPNDFGLSVDEILAAPDKELNAWVSVKKMSQYRTEDEELRDKRVFHKKGRSVQSKQNILTSLWSEKTADDPPPPSATGKQKKRRHEEIDGDGSQSIQKKTKKKCSVKIGNSEKFDVKVEDEKPHVRVEDTKKRRAESDENKTEVTEKKKSAKRQDNERIEKSDQLPNMETEIVNESNQAGLKRKKKNKKKKNANNDIVKSVDAPSSQTVRDSGEKTSVKRTKKKQKNKLPPMSDDRLKAYGISVKKYKYCHSKKLLNEQLH